MKELEITHIPQWKEYTGKGVRIDVMEGFAEDEHGTKVQHVIRQVAPDAIITQRQFDSVSLNQSQAQLINISLDVGTKRLRPEAEKQAVERGIPIIVAVGNRGQDNVAENAKTDHIIAVGAAHMYGDTIRKASYSAYDEKKPDIMALSSVCEYDGSKLLGTTFSAAITTGMLAKWFQWHLETVLSWPTPDQTRAFVLENTIKMKQEGTGAGLFVLPDLERLESSYTKIEMTIGSQTYFVDGQKKEMDSGPIIKDKRTLVPIRVISETFGAQIFWDEKLQKVQIIAPLKKLS